MIHQAILSLYPQVVNIVNDTAYDAEGKEVVYDLQAVQARFAQDEADKETLKQTQISAKASALAKLAALGLTQDEVKALVG